jgi:alkylation response protein AidB-like acyl-CoA dehydrogenase
VELSRSDPAAVTAARDVGERLLRPDAERVDVEGVPRSHLDALAAAGLMNVVGLPAAVAREVTETLAAADASTWFVWTQHHSPVRTVQRSSNDALQQRWLPRLTSGEALAGVAFTHLRRPGPPAVSARRGGDGWVVDGDIAWLTSWGLADVFLIGAQADDEVVWVLADLHGHREAVAEPLQLAAMNGTATVRLRLSGLHVDDADVVAVDPLAQWRADDAARTADVSAAVFGVTAEALRRLREREEPAASDAAQLMELRMHELRDEAYALVDEVPAGERVEERLMLRAQAHSLACRATAALVAAGAGRSMLLDAPAQRLARVALFLMVQGQTAPVRAATLREISAQ